MLWYVYGERKGGEIVQEREEWDDGGVPAAFCCSALNDEGITERCSSVHGLIAVLRAL